MCVLLVNEFFLCVCVHLNQNNLLHFLFVRTNVVHVWNDSLKWFVMKVVLLALLLLM